MTKPAKRKPHRLDERKPLDTPEPFTIELVTGAIRTALKGEKNMRSIGSMPESREIRRLTSALNKLHAPCFAAQEECKKAENIPRAKDLFGKLRKILPEIEEYGSAEAVRAPEYYMIAIDRCAQAIREFLSSGNLAGALHTQSLHDQMRGWQSCADGLHGLGFVVVHYVRLLSGRADTKSQDS